VQGRQAGLPQYGREHARGGGLPVGARDDDRPLRQPGGEGGQALGGNPSGEEAGIGTTTAATKDAAPGASQPSGANGQRQPGAR